MNNFCTSCGAKLGENVKFCEECGAAVVEEGTVETSENANVETVSTGGSNFEPTLDRVKIKEEAKKLIADKKWVIWKPLLVIYLIGLGVGVVENALGESLLASGIELIFSIAVMPLSVGLVLYMLNFVRNKELNISQLFGFYKDKFLLIVGTSFLVGIFTFLWSLLFIIPGIIAALGYTMYAYLLADTNIDNPSEIMNTSKKMMDGHKMDYFVFQLSFIGWILLGLVTFGIVYIYVVPYITVANTLYYENLKKITNVQ